MCGIAGLVNFSNHSKAQEQRRLVQKMIAALQHRGPDANGIWEDTSAGVTFGHQRLSILDLSDAGAQPMVSNCGRYILSFNGEIYNHLNLRAELSSSDESCTTSHKWNGSSDTETILTAISIWGVVETLRRCFGMFALAVWDRKLRQLSLARDRVGEKPLYLVQLADGSWAFTSELSALCSLPGFERQIDSKSMQAYLAYGYVPEGLCIYRGVRKVPPGHVLTVADVETDPTEYPYETLSDVLDEGIAHRKLTNENVAQMEDLERTLMHVIDEQMLSDVPIGCFLSGGIDSSLVASLMQSQCSKQISTFSVGFDISRFNEAPHAAAVANHLGTDHVEFLVTEEDALGEVPNLTRIYDEPFADPSQIPMVLLCKEAKRSISVALSGDGGDEMFGGYNRHVFGPQVLRHISRVPHLLRNPMVKALGLLAPYLTSEDSFLRRASLRLKLPVTAVDQTVRLAPALASVSDHVDLYRIFSQCFHDYSKILYEHIEQPLERSLPALPEELSSSEWMMVMDSLTYLPGDILVKVDRAAMASSLETRAPFLDRRVIAAAWAMPEPMKIAGGTGKLALRQLLARHIPQSLFEKPKQGFTIPIDSWLRGALRTWGESLLREHSLMEVLRLNPNAVTEMWVLHQSNFANRGREIWNVLNLLAWARDNLK